VFDINPRLNEFEAEDYEADADEVEQPKRGRPKGGVRQPGILDSDLVAEYNHAAETYGLSSTEASLAFEPIFKRYWQYIYSLSLTKIGAVYAEDLANETMQTVWERLNGKEIVTNLRGLVRHSFEREYATLLEKLLQGRKLQRARQSAGQPENADGRIKGAVVYSLNATAPGTEDEDLEMINLLEDESADVVEAASRLEHMRLLHQLMEQMPNQYRAPLVCQWLMGMKIKEVAQELGLTIDQVKHNTARGISWLRKNMPGDARDWLN
jgi:RNA polymerase sigma factor (sigma-70 family)